MATEVRENLRVPKRVRFAQLRGPGSPHLLSVWPTMKQGGTVHQRARPMNLFESGEFTLSSGAASAFRIECDALTQEDVETLALMISQMVGPFSDVIGVPRGGLRLAEALKPAAVLVGPVLIVDDVLTTGASITRVRDELRVQLKEEVQYVGTL